MVTHAVSRESICPSQALGKDIEHLQVLSHQFLLEPVVEDLGNVLAKTLMQQSCPIVLCAQAVLVLGDQVHKAAVHMEGV